MSEPFSQAGFPSELPDDAQLRSSIKTSLGEHRASPELRFRITKLLDYAATSNGALPEWWLDVGGPKPERGLRGVVPNLFGTSWRRWAVAAALLILVSLAGITFLAERDSAGHRLYQRQIDLVQRSVTVFHAPELAFERMFASNASVSTLSRQLSENLGFEVIVPDGAAGGWTVSSVGIVSVDATRVGCVVFRHQNRTAVMLAWPAAPDTAAGGVFDVREGGVRVAAVGLGDSLQIWVTAPCEEGGEDDLQGLYDPVLSALRKAR